MFAYCGNNPISREDNGGNAWDTVFDIISLASSIAEVALNPGDPWAWAGLAGDIIDVAIPFVGGVGEVVRGVNTARKTFDAVDTAVDAGKFARKAPAVIGEGMERVTKYADEIGGVTFVPSPGISPTQLMNENRKWINRMMEEGRDIFDIGIDQSRMVRSRYYEMERQATRGYRYLFEVDYP